MIDARTPWYDHGMRVAFNTVLFACLSSSLALGCVPEEQNDDDNGEDTTSQDTGEEEEAEEETTAGAEACADFGDQVGCEAAALDPSCIWITGLSAAREGDVCTVESYGLCVDATIQDTAAGCGQAVGCEGEDTFTSPFHATIDGEVVLMDFCGGTPPAEFQPCGSGEADADPPECACACALFPG